MKGTRIYARGAQMEALIEQVGPSPATNPVRSIYVTGEQMERLIALLNGDAPTNPVRSIYATGEQMERLIAALGGSPATYPARSKYATAEQMERAIAAAGGDPATEPVQSKYATAEQMARLIEALEVFDPLSTISGMIVQWTSQRSKPFEGLTVDITPVQTGTGDPSPENLRPITGVTGCNIVRTGKNLWGGLKMAEDFKGCSGYSIDTDSKTFTYTRSKSNIFTGPFKENTQYTLVLTRTAASGNQSLKWVCTDGTTSAVSVNAASSKTVYAHKSPAGKTLKCIELQYSTTGKVTVYYEESGLFEGEVTADDFEPYTRDTLSIDWSTDLFYKQLQDITFNSNFYYDTGRKLTGADVVTMTITPDSSGQNLFGAYSGTGADARNFSMYIYNSTSSQCYFRYGTDLARPILGTGKRTITFGAGGTTGFKTDATVTAAEFESTDNAYIGALPNSTSTKFSGTIHGPITVGNRLKFVPCERVSDGAIGYYEVYSGTFLTATGSGTPTTSGYETESIDADFTARANAVYGGTLNVLTGELTVTHKLVVYDGLEEWGYSASGANHYFYVSTTSDIKVTQKPISNLFKGVENTSYTNLANEEFAMTNPPGFNYFNVRYDALSSAADFKAMLAETPMTVVCKLVTPITINLDPLTLDTLVGDNVLWADSGDVEVTVYGTPVVEPDADALMSLNILLGGRYTRTGDDPTDEEALDIIMGGDTR